MFGVAYEIAFAGVQWSNAAYTRHSRRPSKRSVWRHCCSEPLVHVVPTVNRVAGERAYILRTHGFDAGVQSRVSGCSAYAFDCSCRVSRVHRRHAQIVRALLTAGAEISARDCVSAALMGDAICVPHVCSRAVWTNMPHETHESWRKSPGRFAMPTRSCVRTQRHTRTRTPHAPM
jgi:hypothetical protein